MIFVNSIMVAVGDLLRADPPLSGFLVEVGMPLNLDQGKLPWMSVGAETTGVEGMQLAGGQPISFDAQVRIPIFHQSYSEVSSGDATLKLMRDQAAIFTAVASNMTLDGTVLLLAETIDAGIYQDDDIQQHYLTNLITLTYDVRGSS